MDRDQYERVVRGVSQGRYHLILGAGASNGVSNPRGELLMADALEERLVEELATRPTTAVGLARAYEAVVDTLGQDGALALMRQLYADCEPLSWHERIVKLAWEAIWTFNIDDVIEAAYSRITERRQRALPVVWSDRPVPYGGDSDDVPLVHLHGCVGPTGSGSKPQLIFSRAEYLAAVHQASQTNWHTRLRGDYSVKPFIIVGARLHEEWDLLEVIQAGNDSSAYGFPSIIVLPSIDEFTRREYERWGLVPLEATAADFFDDLLESVVQPEDIPGPYRTRYLDRILQPLSLDDPRERPDGHDFYGGHAPWWADILEDLDATPRWISDLINEVGSPDGESDIQRLYLVHGPAFSGKSTALLRIGKDLAERGWEPFFLRGFERLDPAEVLHFFDDRDRALLLADGLAGDISEIVNLLAAAKQVGTPMLVVGVERDMYLEHLRRSTPASMIVGLETTVFVEPTAWLWTAILEKRAPRARLGILEGKSPREQQLHFALSARDLYTALASLEDAQGFIDRGIDAYRNTSADLRDAFAAISILARYGLPAPVAVIAAATGVRPRTLLSACGPGGLLADWIRLSLLEPGCVELRHRFLGELITSEQCNDAHETPLSELALAICEACSDRVSIEAIRRKTLEYRIVRELMDVETVKRFLGSDDIDPWYERLEPHYRWNARYWEQRALGLTKALDRASSYARRAVSNHEDPFTLNTLGTVLMRRATSESGLDLGTRLRYWADGLDALVRSTQMAKGEYEHPFMTFFTYTQRLLPDLPAMDEHWRGRLEAAYRDWRADAERLRHFQRRYLLAAADGFPPEWRGA